MAFELVYNQTALDWEIVSAFTPVIESVGDIKRNCDILWASEMKLGRNIVLWLIKRYCFCSKLEEWKKGYIQIH